MREVACGMEDKVAPYYDGGGGVQQQKRQRTSCDFPGGMIFFVNTFLTKFGTKTSIMNVFEKEQKRTKKTKDILGFSRRHDLFCC